MRIRGQKGTKAICWEAFILRELDSCADKLERQEHTVCFSGHWTGLQPPQFSVSCFTSVFKYIFRLNYICSATLAGACFYHTLQQPHHIHVWNRFNLKSPHFPQGCICLLVRPVPRCSTTSNSTSFSVNTFLNHQAVELRLPVNLLSHNYGSVTWDIHCSFWFQCIRQMGWSI